MLSEAQKKEAERLYPRAVKTAKFFAKGAPALEDDLLSEAGWVLCEAVQSWRPGLAPIEQWVVMVIRRKLINFLQKKNPSVTLGGLDAGIIDIRQDMSPHDFIKSLPKDLAKIADARYNDGVSLEALRRELKLTRKEMGEKLLEIAEKVEQHREDL